ncbi:MAG TPA: 4a-hydroxytetrahydrobiopterin dehydratase [Gemmatimonadales bacterium]|nr:4a-hydroxytetrahydrobiopterin dehydratase [Gemmatimonadales bacterium]
MRQPDALLTADQLNESLGALPGWEHAGGWLVRTWKTDGWRSSILIVNAISFLAEAAVHHPDVELHWGSVVARLQTHTAGGVTLKDIDLATRIEQLISLHR